MPILGLQQRVRQVGRIRMGKKSASGNPQKLDQWRLTSPDKTLLEAAAVLYGGTVTPWQGHAGEFELFTTSTEIPVMLAPTDMSQWFEEWSAGGCKRRCDGQTCQLATPDGIKDVICECDPENRTCKMVTRINVMLPELPALGTWRLDTGGFYAATELPATAETLIAYAKQAQFVPVMLAIEPRERKVPGQQTKKFNVPVIRVRETLVNVLSGKSAISLGAGPVREEPAALASSAPALPAAAEEYPEAPPADPETGEVKKNAPDPELTRVLSDFEVVGIAKDWVVGFVPDPQEVREVLGWIHEMGKSVTATLITAKNNAAVKDWATFVAAWKSAREQAQAKKDEAPAPELEEFQTQGELVS